MLGKSGGSTVKAVGLAMAGAMALVTGCDSGLDLPALNQPPENLVMTASPSAGTAPLTVQFTGSAIDHDGTIVSYQLDFGDGSPLSTIPNASHTYNNPPTNSSFYTAVLLVRDDAGAVALTSTSIAMNDCPQSATTRFGCDVRPIFTKFFPGHGTCTGCHGGAGGLTFPGDYEGDYAAAVANARVNTADPDASKLLRKPLGLDSHGGGQLFSSTTDPDYKTIRLWIAAGAQKN